PATVAPSWDIPKTEEPAAPPAPSWGASPPPPPAWGAPSAPAPASSQPPVEAPPPPPNAAPAPAWSGVAEAEASAPPASTDAELTIESGPGAGHSHRAGDHAVRMGRSPDNDIILRDPRRVDTTLASSDAAISSGSSTSAAPTARS